MVSTTGPEARRGDQSSPRDLSPFPFFSFFFFKSPRSDARRMWAVPPGPLGAAMSAAERTTTPSMHRGPGVAPLPPPPLCKYCRRRRQSVAGGGRLSAVTWREASFLCAALFPSSAAILFSPRVGLLRGRRIQVRTPRARRSRPRTAARDRAGRLCGAGLRPASFSRALFEGQRTAVKPCPGLGAAVSRVRGAAPSRCRSDMRPLSFPPAAPCRPCWSPSALCRSGTARLPSPFRL